MVNFYDLLVGVGGGGVSTVKGRLHNVEVTSVLVEDGFLIKKICSYLFVYFIFFVYNSVG